MRNVECEKQGNFPEVWKSISPTTQNDDKSSLAITVYQKETTMASDDCIYGLSISKYKYFLRNFIFLVVGEYNNRLVRQVLVFFFFLTSVIFENMFFRKS